jgi:hypothetical protein
MGRGDSRGRYAVALGALFACRSSAFALNPSLDVSQYAHTSWHIRDGFPKGHVQTIAQSPDGYLWQDTEYGLVRFDGVRHLDWRPPAGPQLPSNHVRHLLVTRDDAVWISTINGLANWKEDRLTPYRDLAGMDDVLLEDRAGSVWVGGRQFGGNGAGKLCEIRSGHVDCFGENEGAGFEFVSLYYPRRFIMRVRDNGKGIDPQVIETGGRAGTEIELAIPAATAYRKVTLPPVPKVAS